MSGIQASVLANPGEQYFGSLATAQAAKLPPAVVRVSLRGVHYVRSDGEPGHDLKFRSGDRYTATAAAEMDPDTLAAAIDPTDGGWWEIDFRLHPKCRPALDPDWDPTGATSVALLSAKWLNAYSERAPQNGGLLYLDLQNSGKALFEWNGETGLDVGFGVSQSITGLNQRSCLVVNHPGVTRIVFDPAGTELIQGGQDKNDWASFLITKGASFHLKGGGTYDFQNLPFTQGTITAIQDESAPGANDGYVEFSRDPAFGQPSFLQVSEILYCTEPNYVLAKPRPRTVEWFALDREEYADAYAPLVETSAGSGIYRVTGLTAAEIAIVNARTDVGAYVVVKGASDVGAWFKVFDAPAVQVDPGSTVHCAMQRFFLATAPRKADIAGCRLVPRDGSPALAVSMRDGIDVFSALGPVSMTGNHVYGSGDDAMAINGMVLSSMTRISPTSFSGMSNPHFYNIPVPDGYHLVIVDNNLQEVARCTIVAAGAINPADGYKAVYTVTVESGALPADMTKSVAVVMEGFQRAKAIGNTAVNIRGRGIWTNVGGLFNSNDFAFITNQAILFGATSGPQYSHNFDGGDGFVAQGNFVRSVCQEDRYSGAISVIARRTDASTTVSTAYPIRGVTITGNLFEDIPNAAVVLAGVDTAQVRNMLINVGYVGNPVDWNGALLANTALGLINCRNVDGTGNHVSGLAPTAVLWAEATASGGANANNRVFATPDVAWATFAPAGPITFATPGDLILSAVSVPAASNRYQVKDGWCDFQFDIAATPSFTGAAAGSLRIPLPVPARSTSVNLIGSFEQVDGIKLSASPTVRTTFVPGIPGVATHFGIFQLGGASAAAYGTNVTDLTSGTPVRLIGHVRYETP